MIPSLPSLKCEQSLLTSAPSSTAYTPIILVLVPVSVCFFQGYSLHGVFSFGFVCWCEIILGKLRQNVFMYELMS